MAERVEALASRSETPSPEADVAIYREASVYWFKRARRNAEEVTSLLDASEGAEALMRERAARIEADERADALQMELNIAHLLAERITRGAATPSPVAVPAQLAEKAA